jgi:hypothetical protein
LEGESKGRGERETALEALELGELPVVGLAKERVARDPVAREIQRRPDRVFLPGRKNPVILRSNSTALFLLQRVRDEAHRFANTYHRTLRSRVRLRSMLDAIDGVGPGRRRALLRHFGSMRRVRAATVDELTHVSGISTALAERSSSAWAERRAADGWATNNPPQEERAVGAQAVVWVATAAVLGAQLAVAAGGGAHRGCRAVLAVVAGVRRHGSWRGRGGGAGGFGRPRPRIPSTGPLRGRRRRLALPLATTSRARSRTSDTWPGHERSSCCAR